MTNLNVLFQFLLIDLFTTTSPIFVDPRLIEVFPCIQDHDPGHHIAVNSGSLPFSTDMCISLVYILSLRMCPVPLLWHHLILNIH